VKDYLINIFYSDEDKRYIADIPDLRYCTAHGASPEEALKEVQVAKGLWLEVARETGKQVPAPRCRPQGFPYQARSRVRKRSPRAGHQPKAGRTGP
jgi:predicted RNase H-like HicB family nuclease